MRIDAKETIGQYPALLVRKALRHLRDGAQWGLAGMEAAAGLPSGEGRAMVQALRSAGLIEPAGRAAWKITQAGMTFSSATAAKRITRATAEEALRQFLARVEQVNSDPYFLGKVTRVVLFGSMLRTEIERLSDVDVAVEVAPKEGDFDRARAMNLERVERLATEGRRFRNFLEQEFCWYLEVFGFLKGRSRVIALADYAVEKALVLTVPHRVLLGETELTAPAAGPPAPQPAVRNRRPRDCPF
jgi:predicted nucleotidyltransferase